MTHMKGGLHEKFGLYRAKGVIVEGDWVSQDNMFIWH
jgi:hypothetical protein